MNFERKIGEQKQRKEFVCKRNIKDQCFLYNNIYNDNKNVYEFIKKC